MARKPYPVAKARRLLDAWIALCVDQPPTEAPITVATAVAHLRAKGITTHRATLAEHDLHHVVAAGKRQQLERGSRRSDAERELYDGQVRLLRTANATLEQQNRALLGEIAVMLHNARRLSVPHEELTAPMTPILPADDDSRGAVRSVATARKPRTRGTGA